MSVLLGERGRLPRLGDADPDVAVKVWLCREAIIEDLRPQDVLDLLRQDGIITAEECEVINHEVTTRDRARLLLDVVVSKGLDGTLSLQKALKETYRHLVNMINTVVVTDRDRKLFNYQCKQQRLKRRTLSRERDMQETLSTLSRELGEHYQRKYQHVQPLPDNSSFSMPLTDIFVPLSAVNVSNARTNGSGIAEVHRLPDGMFRHHEGEPKPKRIMLQGEAGIGKTTLLQKIAYDWSVGGQVKTWVKTFTIVLTFDEQELHGSVASAILDSLLPDDTSLTLETLESLFCNTDVQERTLVLLDSFTDEMPTNGLVKKLMFGKILRSTSVIVASRLSTSRHFEHAMDRKYLLRGFDHMATRLCVDRYLRLSGRDGHQVSTTNILLNKDFLLKELLVNPLYLILMCAMLDEKCPVVGNRTNLLANIIHLTYKKHQNFDSTNAVDCVNGKRQAVHSFQQLARLAYDSLPRHTKLCVVSADKFKALGSVEKDCGFLRPVTSKSPLSPSKGYTFIHAVIQEFLAATHVWMKSLVNVEHAVSLLKRLPRFIRSPVVVFLVGILKLQMCPTDQYDSVNDGVTKQSIHKYISAFSMIHATPQQATFILRVLIDNVILKKQCLAEPLYMQGSADFIHDKGHLSLMCLAENGSNNPSLDYLMKRIKTCRFFYQATTCSQCLRGFLVAAEHTDPGQSELMLDGFDLEVHEPYGGRMIEELSARPFVKSLTISNIWSCGFIVRWLPKVLNVTSDIQHLALYLSPQVVPESIPSADGTSLKKACSNMFDLETIVVIGSPSRYLKGGESIELLLEVILVALLSSAKPKLKTLVLKQVTITTHIWKSLKDIITNACKLDRIALDNVWMERSAFEEFSKCLHGIAVMRKLTISSVQLFYADNQQQLKPGMVQSPSVTDALPDELFDGFRKCIVHNIHVQDQSIDPRQMDSLLSLSCASLHCLDLSYTSTESATWGLLVHKLPRLNRLRKLVLKGCRLDSVCIGDIIHGLVTNKATLSELDLSENDNFGRDEENLQSICQNLSQLHTLRVLKLDRCGLLESSMTALQAIFKRSVPENGLHTLTLLGNFVLPQKGFSRDGNISSVASITNTFTHTQLFRCTTKLHTLHFPLSQHSLKVAAEIADSLSGNTELSELFIASLPSQDLVDPVLVKTIYDTYCEAVPSIHTLGFGMNADVFDIRAPKKQDHDVWREFCFK